MYFIALAPHYSIEECLYIDLYSIDLYSIDLYSIDLYSIDLYSIDLYSIDFFKYYSFLCLYSDVILTQLASFLYNLACALCLFLFNT